jgi:hypothetical protein
MEEGNEMYTKNRTHESKHSDQKKNQTNYMTIGDPSTAALLYA